MNCKEFQLIAKRSSARAADQDVNLIEAHVRDCENCRNLLLSERLAPAIIRAASEAGRESIPTRSNAMILSGIKRRIQEIREQRSGSWEAAVEAMSGWLAAFAAAAIILVVGALQWRPPAKASDLDFSTPAQDEHLISEYAAPTKQTELKAIKKDKGAVGNDLALKGVKKR